VQHLAKKKLNKSTGFLKPKTFFGLAFKSARFFSNVFGLTRERFLPFG